MKQMAVREIKFTPNPQQESPLALFYCFDQNFAHPSLISLCSALSQLSQPMPVYLFSTQLKENTIQAVAALNARFCSNIRLFEIDAAQLKGFHSHAHLSDAAFMRILVPELMTEPYLLYLDGDTLVRRDLWEVQAYCAPSLLRGVPDTRARQDGQLEKLGLPPEGQYINTGVLLIHRQRWAQEGITQRLLERYQQLPNPHELLTWLDQDLLNLVLQAELTELPEDWNLMHQAFGYWGLKAHWQNRRGIFHFASHIKPWMRCADLWAQELWYQAGLNCPLGPMATLEPRNNDEHYYYSRALYHAERYKEAYQALRHVLLSPLQGYNGKALP